MDSINNFNLKNDENRYQFLSSAVEQCFEGIAVADMEGKLVYVNPAWAKMHGYESGEQLIGSPLKISHNDEQLKNDVLPFNEIVKEKGAHTGEVGHIRRDGTPFPTLMTTTLLKDGQGRPVAILGMAKDISVQKKYEIELAEEKNKYEAVITALRDGITVHDKNYRIIFQNDIHKERQGDHIGEICYMAYQKRDTICPGCVVEKTLADGLPHRRESRAPGKNGSTIHMEVSSSPVFGANGEIVSVVEVVHDISHMKKAEEEKINLEKRLQQAQKMEAIGTLAGGIAHDFNNILSVILGYTTMARDDAPQDSKLAEDLQNVLKAGYRAKDLVKQILTFSRQTEIERIPIKVQSFIKEALKMLRASMPATIKIQENFDQKCGVILADPTQIHQILVNLCTNANYAMEESGGTLKIELKSISIDRGTRQSALHIEPGEYVELVVSDTGSGIGPDVIDRVFEPYFTTKDPGKGTGMGLAIIHGIVKEYGGAITVESELGKGSAFHVYFPVIELEELPFVEDTEDLPLGKERILFIDDEELLLKMGKNMLERLGYSVIARRSSRDALATFQKCPEDFDLVITDQTMPDMTGTDLASRLMQIRPGMPIILCTGYSNLIDEPTAKSLGIKEFVLKPLTQNAIAKLIRKVLDVS